MMPNAFDRRAQQPRCWVPVAFLVLAFGQRERSADVERRE